MEADRRYDRTYLMMNGQVVANVGGYVAIGNDPKFRLSLSNVQLSNLSINDCSINLHELRNFEVMTLTKDAVITYWGCQWLSIHEDGTIGSMTTKAMTVISSRRTEEISG